MSERAEKLYDGITGISDQIVERAERYVFPKRRKRYYGLAAWGTVAACACLIVMVTLPYLASGGSSDSSMSAGTAAETEKAEAPSTQVMEDKEVCQGTTSESVIVDSTASDFGGLFPQLLLAGYESSEGICIYDGKVLVAKYCNAELSDEMSIRIAYREWFAEELGEVETDVIFYGEGEASRIYISSGDYIAEYAFSSRDIAKLAGFYDMVVSAPCFAEE